MEEYSRPMGRPREEGGMEASSSDGRIIRRGGAGSGRSRI